MPLAAVAGIFISGAALATGTLGTMATIAAIGTMVGSIGMLTGNKTLMTIGAVASLAGGIGAFAQGQGWIASADAASAMGDAAASNTQVMAQEGSALVENVTPVVDAGGATAAAVTDSIGDAVAASGSTGGLESAAGSLADSSSLTQNITQSTPLAAEAGGLMNASSPNELSLAAGTQQAPESLTNSLDQAATMESATNPVTAPTDPSANPSARVMGSSGQTTPATPAAPGTNPTDLRLQGGTQTTPMAGASSPIGDLLGKFGDIFKNADGTWNKDMVSMAANFVGGAFDDKKEAETDYLKAQADQINKQMENASAVPEMNFQNKSRGPLFKKKPLTYRSPAVGLMNAR